MGVGGSLTAFVAAGRTGCTPVANARRLGGKTRQIKSLDCADQLGQQGWTDEGRDKREKECGGGRSWRGVECGELEHLSSHLGSIAAGTAQGVCASSQWTHAVSLRRDNLAALAALRSI